MNPKLVPAAACALLLLPAAPSLAQAPAGRWMLGLDAVAGSVARNDDAADLVIDEKGGGLGLQVGFLLKPSFMLRLCAAATDHDTTDPDVTIRLGGSTIDAVFLFRHGLPFRPYLFAGLGGFQAKSRQQDLTYDISGTGLAVGAGMHLRLGGRATLHGALRVEAINWENARATWERPGGSVEVEVPIDEDGWASKVMLGVGLWL